MSATPAVSSSRPPLMALGRYSLRACLPPKRRLALLAPCAGALLFGLIARTVNGYTPDEFARIASVALFALVLPVTALVVGDAVLGAELRRGSFTFTWMSPVPPWQIVVARWAGGTLVTGGALAASFALSALVAGVPGAAGPAALAVAAGSACYVAFFMAIGSIAQRAAVWSIAFVFLFERLLGAALSGVAQLSPSWVARSTFIGLNGGPDFLHRHGVPDGGAGLVRLALLTAIALVVAVRRLPHMQMAGSTD